MRYRHFRLWEVVDHEMRLCKPAQRGGATAAYDPGARTGGVAVCSHRDAYCRRTGRELATQRAMADGYPCLDEVMVVAPRLRRGHPCHEGLVDAIEWILLQARL